MNININPFDIFSTAFNINSNIFSQFGHFGQVGQVSQGFHFNCSSVSKTIQTVIQNGKAVRIEQTIINNPDGTSSVETKILE